MITIADAAKRRNVTPQGMHWLIKKHGLTVRVINARCHLIAPSELRKLPKIKDKRKAENPV